MAWLKAPFAEEVLSYFTFLTIQTRMMPWESNISCKGTCLYEGFIIDHTRICFHVWHSGTRRLWRSHTDVKICLQARFLLARLNPSQTHEERAPASIRTGEIIVTEDIPFGEFYKYFSEAVVESPWDLGSLIDTEAKLLLNLLDFSSKILRFCLKA